MIGQSILSNPMGSVKALAGSHPIGLGVLVGIGAYYAVNKYLLSSASEGELTEEVVEDVETTTAEA